MFAGAWGVRINIRRYCVKKVLALIATLDVKVVYADVDFAVIDKLSVAA